MRGQRVVSWKCFSLLSDGCGQLLSESQNSSIIVVDRKGTNGNGLNEKEGRGKCK